MNEKAKKLFIYAAALALLIFAYAALSYVNTYSSSIQPSAFRSFSVTGEGKVTAIPDVAEFTFSIITEGGKDLASLQKTNTESANKAIDFVKSKGVNAKDIKTQGYDVSPRYTNYTCRPIMMQAGGAYGSGASSGSGGAAPMIYPLPPDRSCPPSEITGYTITQTVSVKIRDFAKAGEILSGVVSNGANSVSQLYFSIDDRAVAENQARAEAIAKAKDKAKAIAKAGGFGLGRLLSIDEGYSGGPIYMRADAGFSKGAPEAAPAPTIEPGSQDVLVNVTLRYEIK